MNWSEQAALDAHDDDDADAHASALRLPASDAASAAQGGALFLGDTGTLPFDARRALCQLLAGPSIDAQRHGALWPALLRNEPAVRQVLCELFLEPGAGPRRRSGVHPPGRHRRAWNRPPCCAARR